MHIYAIVNLRRLITPSCFLSVDAIYSKQMKLGDKTSLLSEKLVSGQGISQTYVSP